MRTLFINTLILVIMTTIKKSSATSRKGRKVSKSELNAVVTVAAGVGSPAGSGVTSGGASAGSVLPAVGGGVRSSKGRNNNADQLAVSASLEDVKVSELGAKIRKYFAVPEWAGAAALRASLLPLVESGVMSGEQFDAVCSAAARKAGVIVPVCSLPRVLAVVRRHFAKDFENVCGVSFASVRAFFAGGGSFGVFSNRINTSLAVEDSRFEDFITCEPLPVGASASAVIRAFLSVRFAGAFLAARAAARAAGRNELKESAANLVRRAARLGVSAAVLSRYLSVLAVAVPANDAKEEKRLTRSLGRQLSALAALNSRIMLACPAVSDVDSSGDFFVPASAVLPASCPAKVRKLWGKRSRVLSGVNTLRGLLSRC